MITQSEYNDEIAQLAEGIFEEVREFGGDISDLAFMAVDGHQWIIYTAYHSEIIERACNPDAYQDVYSNEDLGALVVEGGMSAAVQAQAFFAFESDLQDACRQVQIYRLEGRANCMLSDLNGE